MQIVTVDFAYVPTEGLPSIGQRLEERNFFGSSADLKAISIYDCDNILQFLGSGHRSGFPYGSFLKLAVTHQNVAATIGFTS
jgi:hypothetical protein